MSISILGGHAKGHALFVPKGDATKPTTVMLRRKFFDSYQNCEGMIFIDLFSGTGAMALEAISRGANKAITCELNKLSYQVLKQNIASIKKRIPDAHVESFQVDAKKWLTNFMHTYEHLSLELKENTHIYIDPPYELKKMYLECLEIIFSKDFIGHAWIESDKQKGILEEQLKEHGYQTLKTFSQGTSFITLVDK